MIGSKVKLCGHECRDWDRYHATGITGYTDGGTCAWAYYTPMARHSPCISASCSRCNDTCSSICTNITARDCRRTNMGHIHTSMQSCNAMNQYNKVDCVSDITRQQHNIIMQSVKAVYQCIQSQGTASYSLRIWHPCHYRIHKYTRWEENWPKVGSYSLRSTFEPL